MDNTATKGVVMEIERELAQQVFQKQAEFLRIEGKKQNYK